MACKYKYKGQEFSSEKELIVFLSQRKNISNGALNAVGINPVASLSPHQYSTDQWVGMTMRRAMQMAAQEGFDRIAWVTGEQSAERYDLSKQVDSIEWANVSTNNKAVVTINLPSNTLKYTVNRSSGEIEQTLLGEDYTGKNLEDVIGKELSQKILSEKFGELEGDGLKVGGEGMKAFYNSILPKVAKKEAQRFDKKAKVEVIDFRGKSQYMFDENLNELTDEEKQSGVASKQLSIALTPKMIESLLGGIPMFSRQGSKADQVRNQQFLNFVVKRPELVERMLNDEGFTRGFLLGFQQKAGVTLDAKQVLGHLKKLQAEQKLQEEAQKQAKRASSEKADLGTGLDEVLQQELEDLGLKDSELPRYTRRLLRSKIIPRGVKIALLHSEAGTTKRSITKQERIALAEAYLEGVQTKSQLRSAFKELKEDYDGTINESMLWRTAALVRIGLRLTAMGDIDTVAEINELLVSVSSLAGSVLGVFSNKMDDLTMIGAIQLGEVAAISKKLNKSQVDPKDKSKRVKPITRIKALADELSKLEAIQEVVAELSKENSELKQKLNTALSEGGKAKRTVSTKFKSKARSLRASAVKKLDIGLGKRKAKDTDDTSGVSYSRQGGKVDISSFIDPVILKSLVELVESFMYESGGDISTARTLFNQFLKEEGYRADLYREAGGKFDIFEEVSRTEGFQDVLLGVRTEIVKERISKTLNNLLRQKQNTPLVGLVSQLVNSKNAKRNAKLNITNPLDSTATDKAKEIVDSKRKEAEAVLEEFKEGKFNKEELESKLKRISKETEVALDDAGEIVISPEFNAISSVKPVVGDIISVGSKTYSYTGSNWVNESTGKGATNKEVAAINFALQNNYITQSKINEVKDALEGGFITKDEALMAWQGYKESISHLPESKRRAALNTFEELLYDGFNIDVTGNVANRIGVGFDLALANTTMNDLLNQFYVEHKGVNLENTLMEKLGVSEELAGELAKYIKSVLREQVEGEVRNTISKFINNPNSLNKAVDLVMDGRMNMDDFKLAFGEEYGFSNLSVEDIEEFRRLLEAFKGAKYSVDEKKALDDIREFLLERKKETWIQYAANLVRDVIYTSMLNAPPVIFTAIVGGGLPLAADILTDFIKTAIDSIRKADVKPWVALGMAHAYGLQGFFTKGLFEAAYIFKTGESSRSYMPQDIRNIKKSALQKTFIDKYNAYLKELFGDKPISGKLKRAAFILFGSVVSLAVRTGKLVSMGDAMLRGYATPYNAAISVHYDNIAGGNNNISDFLKALHKELGKVPEVEVILSEEVKQFGLEGIQARRYRNKRRQELEMEFGNSQRLEEAERISGRYALMQTSEGIAGAISNSLSYYTNANVYDSDAVPQQVSAAIATTLIDLQMPFVLKVGSNALNGFLGFTPYNAIIKPALYYGSLGIDYIFRGNNATGLQAFDPFSVLVARPDPKGGLIGEYTKRTATEKIRYWSRSILGSSAMVVLFALMFSYDEDDEGNLIFDIPKDEKGFPISPIIITGRGTGSFSANNTVFEGYERNAVLVKKDGRYVKLFNTDRQVIGSMFAPLGYITDKALFGTEKERKFSNVQSAMMESFKQGMESLGASVYLEDIVGTVELIANYMGGLFNKDFAKQNKAATKKLESQFGLGVKASNLAASTLHLGNLGRWTSDMYNSFNNKPQLTTPNRYYKTFTDVPLLNSTAKNIAMFEEAYATGIKRLPGGTPLVKDPNLITDLDILDEMLFGKSELDYTSLDKALIENPSLYVSNYYGSYSAAGIFENGVASQEFYSKVILNHPERYGLMFEEVKDAFESIDEDHSEIDGYKVRSANELRMSFLTSLRNFTSSYVKAEAMLDIMEREGVDFGDRRRFTTKTSTITGVDLRKPIRRLDHTKVKEWLVKRGLTLGEDGTVKKID